MSVKTNDLASKLKNDPSPNKKGDGIASNEGFAEDDEGMDWVEREANLVSSESEDCDNQGCSPELPDGFDD